MNRKIILAGLIALATASVRADETNLFAKMNTPPNEFAVLADPKSSVNDDVLAESLDMRHWNFQLQITNNYWACFSIDFRWQENGAIRDLGHAEFSIIEQTPGMSHHKILLMVSPVDLSTEEPWRNSAKLRVFVKDYDRSSGSFFVENPFKKNKEIWMNYGIAGLVDHSPRKAEFKLMTSGNNEFRVCFNPGDHTTVNGRPMP